MASRIAMHLHEKKEEISYKTTGVKYNLYKMVLQNHKQHKLYKPKTTIGYLPQTGITLLNPHKTVTLAWKGLPTLSR